MEPLITIALLATLAVANCLTLLFLVLERRAKQPDAPPSPRSILPQSRRGKHKPKALSDEDAWAREQKEHRERF